MRAHKVVCVSGYFDPIHAGYIEYLKDAKALGDKLVVILNRDCQRPHYRFHLTERDRECILRSIRYVDEVVISVDSDESVCKTLELVRPAIFARGASASGDEIQTCKDCGIHIVTNVGPNIHLANVMYELRP